MINAHLLVNHFYAFFLQYNITLIMLPVSWCHKVLWYIILILWWKWRGEKKKVLFVHWTLLLSDLDPTGANVDTEAHPELVIGKTDAIIIDADAEVKKTSIKISNKKVTFSVAVWQQFLWKSVPGDRLPFYHWTLCGMMGKGKEEDAYSCQHGISAPLHQHFFFVCHSFQLHDSCAKINYVILWI